MKKKLLVLASTFPTSADNIQPEFVKMLSHILADSFDTTVLVPHAPGIKQKERVGNLTVVRYRYFFDAWETLAYGSGILNNLKADRWKLLLVPFFFFGQLLALIQLLRKEQFDYVHAHWIIPQGVVAAIARVFSRNPPGLLVTSHGGDLFSMQGRLGSKLKKWVLNKADSITVVSAVMKQYCVSRLGVDPDKIAVVSMGVDLNSRFVPCYKSPRNPFGLIFVGRLVEKKGVIYLVRAMPLILKRFPSAKLTIIGDGILNGQLSQEARRLNVSDSILFLGAVHNDRIPDYLSQNTISVVPSVISASGDQEGLGLVAVEAIGCGCVVVASGLEALKDVITHAETGLLSKPECPEDIAKNICYLLDNPDKAKKLAIAARTYVLGRFDWSIIGDKYRRLIQLLPTPGCKND